MHRAESVRRKCRKNTMKNTTKTLANSDAKTLTVENIGTKAQAFDRIESLFADRSDTIENAPEAIDIADYIGDRFSGGTRKAVLAADVAIRGGRKDQVKSHLLSLGYKKQTVSDIFNAGGLMPILREEGLADYPALLNLTAVGKALRDVSHPKRKAVLKGMREGKSAANLRKTYEGGKPKADPKRKANPPGGAKGADPVEDGKSAVDRLRDVGDMLAGLLPLVPVIGERGSENVLNMRLKSTGFKIKIESTK